ncbi:SusC/RagA family TonB-linked outer membrane protein [Parabacteroides distasonis]|uniref:SusC/RagA family TonB-linked outer membrane protein n=1 Tax=Parabacteroides distasonis TaxID=823 RepID=UPI001C3E4FDF|nr:TonB-dependent receptor [Parabacteroides distasonis]MCR1854387.1 TonB-dependent receptor [Parabacteroides distasonis]MCX4381442.1 TonB-dependent receptor [Parabacteroides distasonis]
MKIIEMNKRGRYSHTLFGHKVVRLLLAASLQCGLFVPYVFGDNNLHINIMNQDGVVSGLVRDATGMPLIGVSVVVKGTMQGVVTDMDGKFSLEVPRGSVLVFSYIGMQSVEMSVTDQKDLNIVMKENSEAIDEIVVVGYGTVKKSNLSGAVSSVSSKDLQKLPAANLSQALQGNAPGLYSLQSSRDPGASVSLSIRGKNSFSGGDPLFIVDGFPIASGGGVNAINPNDIESVSILKDASSTAIYGARAANGVVLITTKSGKIGKPVLEVNAYCGIKFFNNPIEMMDAQSFAQLRRESYEMDGITMPSNAFLPAEQQMLDRGQSTDWWRETTGSARLTQNYQVSFSSGTETTKVHVGAGFFDEQGIVNNSGYKRGSLRFNASQKFGDRVTVSTFNNISLMAKKGTNETNVLFPAMVGNPMSPVRNENGEYYAMIQNALGTPRANPVAFSELPKNNEIEPLINTSLALEVKLIDGLRFKTQISGEIDNYKKNFYNPRSISGEDEVNGRISGGYALVTSSVNYNWISETTLMYNKTFNQIHNIDAVVGFSAQQNRWETVTASASGFASDVYESFNLGASSAAARKPSSNLKEWSMVSYIGRVVYTLRDKYIFTGNMRVDGSSRFGENNKYGYFPSGAVAWKVSEENFMKDIDWLSDMKLRASYGLSGNANALEPYQTMSKLSYAPYNFNSLEAPGYYESNMPSADLKWETTKQLDLGLDFSVFNRRLNIVFDYYAKNTKDLIRAIDIPAVSGFPSTYVNMGNLRNRGVELGFNSINLDGEFVWKTSFMIATNKNKLTSLGDGSDKIGTSHWVGKPIGIGNRYMIQADGIWQSDQKEEAAKYGSVPGDVRYIDQNKDGKINDEDRVFVGSYYPNFYGSMTNDFAYKNFDLSVFMTFEQGRDIYNGNNYILLSGAGVDNNRIEMLERWTPSNPSNKYPRASATSKNRLSTTTSEFLEDGSYLKIKNITLGYTIPSKIISKAGMSYFRVYASVNNPFTFTKYTGLDPEDGDIWNNDRKSTYPITTNYMLGLQLKF